jgi:L-rhamnose mutarotase
MQDLFDGAIGRVDQSARILPEVFNLEDQLAAARER